MNHRPFHSLVCRGAELRQEKQRENREAVKEPRDTPEGGVHEPAESATTTYIQNRPIHPPTTRGSSPDDRNGNGRNVRAMVEVWRDQKQADKPTGDSRNLDRWDSPAPPPGPISVTGQVDRSVPQQKKHGIWCRIKRWVKEAMTRRTEVDRLSSNDTKAPEKEAPSPGTESATQPLSSSALSPAETHQGPEGLDPDKATVGGGALPTQTFRRGTSGVNTDYTTRNTSDQKGQNDSVNALGRDKLTHPSPVHDRD